MRLALTVGAIVVVIGAALVVLASPARDRH